MRNPVDLHEAMQHLAHARRQVSFIDDLLTGRDSHPLYIHAAPTNGFELYVAMLVARILADIQTLSATLSNASIDAEQL